MSYKRKDGIVIHDDPEDFEKMRKAGRIAAECLDYITPYVQVGVSTGELDDLCREFSRLAALFPLASAIAAIPSRSASPSTMSFATAFPIMSANWSTAICLTLTLPVFWTDGTAIPAVCICRQPSIKAKRLVEVTYECMMRGIDVVKPGARMGDIGAVIAEYAHKYGYSVVDMFCGHGLGQVFHDEPNVMHIARKGTGPLMEEGMFFTIEPMINIGKPDAIILKDGWTSVTRDKSLSAQFEHSLAVTKDGYEVFTYSPKGLDKPPYKL